MRIPDQTIQMQFRSVRRRFKGRYRRAVGPIEVTALLNVIWLASWAFAGDGPYYYWPIWPMIGTVIPVIVFTLIDGAGRGRPGGDRRRLGPGQGHR